MVSTFDEGKAAATYGSWMGGGDLMSGGKSTRLIAVVEPGAGGHQRRAADHGRGSEERFPSLFAGAFYFSGNAAPIQPANLSSKKDISFWAKGDGNTYSLLMMKESDGGQGEDLPAMGSVRRRSGVEAVHVSFHYI